MRTSGMRGHGGMGGHGGLRGHGGMSVDMLSVCLCPFCGRPLGIDGTEWTGSLCVCRGSTPFSVTVTWVHCALLTCTTCRYRLSWDVGSGALLPGCCIAASYFVADGRACGAVD